MAYFFSGKILFFYIMICAVITILFTIKREKKHRIIHVVLNMIFFIYLYFIIDITQFPIYITEGMREALSGNIWANIQLTPFKNIINFSSFYNIIMTIPIGFLVPLMSRNNIKFFKLILLALIPGILIEGMQLVQLLLIGYTFRIIDINDIICNFTGVMTGYLIFAAAKKAAKVFMLRFNVEERG